MTAPAAAPIAPDQVGAQLWLLRLVLNPRSREARRDLRSCVAMHSRLCSLFVRLDASTERRSARREFGLLYRVEAELMAPLPYVLLQAKALPDWTALPTHYALEVAGKSIGVNGIQAGTALRFRLRANPTSRPGRSERRSGERRVGIREPEAALAWLRRRGDSGGFEVVAATVRPENPVIARQRPDEAPMTFTSMLYDGLLHVTHPATFAARIAQGIGPGGLSYGFGLLSLGPT